MTGEVSGHRVFTSTSSQPPSKLLFVDSKAVASFIHAPTSPLGVVTAVLRGSISSLMEERKFCEIRKASCSKGKSGWSLGVCFSKSCTRKKQKQTLIQFIQLTTFLKQFSKRKTATCFAFWSTSIKSQWWQQRLQTSAAFPTKYFLSLSN